MCVTYLCGAFFPLPSSFPVKRGRVSRGAPYDALNSGQRQFNGLLHSTGFLMQPPQEQRGEQIACEVVDRLALSFRLGLRTA